MIRLHPQQGRGPQRVVRCTRGSPAWVGWEGGAPVTDEASRLRRLIAALPQLVVELDDQLRISFLSRSDPLLSEGVDFLEHLAPEYAAFARETIVRTREDGILRSFSYRSQGRELFAWVTKVSSDERRGTCLAIQDRTEAQVAERALTAERRRLEVALEASGVGLWSWHLPSGRVDWDARMRELTGRDTPLTLPDWIEQLAHPDDRERMRGRENIISKPGKFESEVARFVRPDGEVRWAMTAGTVLADGEGNPEWVVGGLMDVTEQHRVAEELENAHRTESLAQLTGGVAHNFNNMLMVIAPCLEFIRETASGDILEDVEDALKATRRAAEIVTQLMTFSGRHNNREKTSLKARAVCEEMIRLCRRSFPSDIQIVPEVVTTATIEVVPGSVEQILGNILFNARDALLSARILEPKVRVTARDVTYFDDDWVEITVSDNGPGVPAEVRDKLFEPFVTSKRGSGTGLGLASSMALAQQQGGQLAYRPSEWGGAEFLLLLPHVPGVATSDAVDTESSRSTLTRALNRPAQRLLVIDDEPAIRRVLCSGLPRFGFDVTGVEGKDQLEILLEKDDEFSLVLLDRSLGNENGTKLLPLLRRQLPRARILFFTGEFINDHEARLVDGVVEKPIPVRSLALLLHESLGGGEEQEYPPI